MPAKPLEARLSQASQRAHLPDKVLSVPLSRVSKARSPHTHEQQRSVEEPQRVLIHSGSRREALRSIFIIHSTAVITIDLGSHQRSALIGRPYWSQSRFLRNSHLGTGSPAHDTPSASSNLVNCQMKKPFFILKHYLILKHTSLL